MNFEGLGNFFHFQTSKLSSATSFFKTGQQKVLDMLLKNFLFYITSFHALISLLTGRNTLFMQKLCLAQDVEASQAGLDNQSPLLRLLSSDRSILSTGAALAVKEVVFIRAEREWPVFEDVCCGLLCPGKAKLCFSAGCNLAQPVMSLIFSLVD